MDLKQISRVCSSFKGKYNATLFQGGLLRLLIAVLAFGILEAVFDWVFHFKFWPRFLFLFISIGSGIFLFWWTGLLAMKKKWTDEQVLAYLDNSSELDQKGILELYELIKAVGIEELESKNGKTYLKDAVATLNEKLSKVNYKKAVHAEKLFKWALAVGVLVGLIGLSFVLSPDTTKTGLIRFANPWTDMRWPHKTTIEVVEPASGWNIPQLENFKLDLKVTGEVPSQVTLSYKSESTGYWIDEKLNVANNGNVSYEFSKVVERIQLYVKGGDYETNEFEINVIERPYLKAVTADFKFPPYAGVPNKKTESGQLSGLEGTEVKLQFTVNMPLKKALMIFESDVKKKKDEIKAAAEEAPVEEGAAIEPAPEKPAVVEGEEKDATEKPAEENAEKKEVSAKPEVKAAPAVLTFDQIENSVGKELTKVSDYVYEVTLFLERNDSYKIKLFEVNGFDQSKPEVFEIQVTPDEKPLVEINAPGQNLYETKNAAIDFSVKVTDDFGIKSLAIYYQINQGEEKLLGDKITGPIKVGGRSSEVSFNWDLKKMDDLPDTGILQYYVRAQDVNPTGNGKTETKKYEINLVKPSQYHQEAVLKASGILNEAMIAWKGELESYQAGLKYPGAAQNNVDDPAWEAIVSKHEACDRAIQSMQAQMQLLTEKYQRNRMQKEFMSGRLASISRDITEMNDKYVKQITQSIKDARPKTDADAGRVKDMRTTAYGQFKDSQKFTVLYLERVLKKLFDWRDLQDTTIKTTNIEERQSEILVQTQIFAPIGLGKEFEDLDDDQQTTLIELGKQQKSIYDAETSLETMLEYLMVRAKKNNRKAILEPLDDAFKKIRNARVNDMLKKISRLIEGNQCSMVTTDQKKIADLMLVVKSNLMSVGQKVDPDAPIKLDGAISDPKVFEDPKEVEEKDKPKAVLETKTTDGGEQDEEEEITPENQMKQLTAAGGDALSLAIQLVIDTQDKVLARARYLKGLAQEGLMPRFIMLKMGRMTQIQGSVKDLLASTIAIADKDNKPFVKQELERVAAFVNEIDGLLKAKDISETSQVFIDNMNGHMKNLIQYIAHLKDINDLVVEHGKSEGKDAFGRLFLAQEADLKILQENSYELYRSYILSFYVSQNISRFISKPAVGDAIKKLEAAQKDLSAKLLGEVKGKVEAESKKVETLTEPVKVMYASYDGYAAYKFGYDATVGNITAGKNEDALNELKQLNAEISGMVSSIRDLIEERVKEKEAEVVEVPDEPVDEEEFKKSREAATLAGEIDALNISDAEKAVLKRALSEKFSEKYKPLMAAYFRTIIDEKKGAVK